MELLYGTVESPNKELSNKGESVLFDRESKMANKGLGKSS